MEFDDCEWIDLRRWAVRPILGAVRRSDDKAAASGGEAAAGGTPWLSGGRATGQAAIKCAPLFGTCASRDCARVRCVAGSPQYAVPSARIAASGSQGRDSPPWPRSSPRRTIGASNPARRTTGPALPTVAQCTTAATRSVRDGGQRRYACAKLSGCGSTCVQSLGRRSRRPAAVGRTTRRGSRSSARRRSRRARR